MSLFDDNFIISMEAKAKAAKEDDDVKEPAEGEEKECDCGKEDCPVCNPKADDAKEEPKEECGEAAEGGEPAEGDKAEGGDKDDTEAEVTPEEEAAITLAVDNDINADSILEARSFESLIASDAEDAHYACLEAVSATIAFDQADIACTEAYVKAESAYEKQLVTESFKDSVKKYGARFKQFLIKIKNAIVRIFSKAVNHIKILGARIAAKFASLMKVKDFYDNVKALSYYDSGVEASFGDRFLTLSTCSYHTENGRFVVVAKEVEPGDFYEPLDIDTDKTKANN